MRNRVVEAVTLFVTVFVAAAFTFYSRVVPAQETVRSAEISTEQLLFIIQGGLLYDNWYAQLGTPAPIATHPAYPDASQQKGPATWRCQECHGWDYKGNRGTYAKGSHYTGIGGIRNMTDSPVSTIVEILKNEKHRYDEVMPEANLEALAFFVAHGQVDVDQHIDRTTHKVRGDKGWGERIYQTTCARCHGPDGRFLNFNTVENPVFIGTFANRNPWMTLHKIRMGHPDADMISMLAFGIDAHVAILAYAQSLPDN